MSAKTADITTAVTTPVVARDVLKGHKIWLSSQLKTVAEAHNDINPATGRVWRTFIFEDGTDFEILADGTVTRDVSFQVGDGATERLHTDSHAYTVIRVSPSGKTVTLQRDKVTLDPSFKPDTVVGGFLGHTVNNHEQSYTYGSDPEGAVITARFTKHGWRTPGGRRIVHGRHEFYDYNF